MSVDIHNGDCLDVLRTIADDSIDACVTDPPYGIRFMGKAWDGADIEKRAADRMGCAHDPSKRAGYNGGHRSIAAEAGKYDRSNSANRAFQEFSEAWAREMFRILKPGAHLVSFASTRTYHRMTCGIEDAGFEIRDQLAWVFGSGFPKSHNLEGEWDGWGTALKPAWEPIVLARKPLNGTVAANVAAHGTGAINIDACRIEGEKAGGSCRPPLQFGGENARPSHLKDKEDRPEFDRSLGRWPANLCHDGSEEVLAVFPDAPGQIADASTSDKPRNGPYIYGSLRRDRGTEESADSENSGDVGFKMKPGARRLDEGSAARFFYCAKASREDRDAGLDQSFPKKPLLWSSGSQNPGSFQSEGTDKSARNFHPTVKPTALMRWLCKLITPPGGRIIDPFLGSGSTGRGAVLEGFDFIGIEKDASYLPLARARIAEAQGELFANFDLSSQKPKQVTNPTDEQGKTT